MNLRCRNDELVFRLKRRLPLGARCRPPLLAYLQARLGPLRVAPRLKITDLFSNAEGMLLCKFLVEDVRAGQTVFIAPLQDIALEKRFAISAHSKGGASRRMRACGA